MPLPYKTYTNETGTIFSFSSIQFLSGTPVSDQLQVYKNSVKLVQGANALSGADYWVQETGQTITLATALVVTDTLQIRRETNELDRIASLSDGARLSAASLNKCFDQVFFLIQEKTFSSTTVEDFPLSLIDITGVSNRDTITWEAAQSKFVPGQLNIGIDELIDVNTSGVSGTGEVLTWSGTQWVPQTNISFDATANLTFSGDVVFSEPLTVPQGTATYHAVNRGQVQGIVQNETDIYLQGLNHRINTLESATANVIGRGRYWNTAGNYYPTCQSSAQTFPAFTSNAGNADYENLYNVSLVDCSYVSKGTTQVGGTEVGTDTYHTLLGNWSQWDTFTWDFQFDDSLVVEETTRSNVGAQYHVILSIDGKTDDFTERTRDGSVYYSDYLNANLSPGYNGDPSGDPIRPTHFDLSDGYPYYMDLHMCPASAHGGTGTTGADPEPVKIQLGGTTPGGDTIDRWYLPFQKWGESHYFQEHNKSRGFRDTPTTPSNNHRTWMEDRKSGMKNVTEPMTVGPMVCRKTQTGFSVMFAMRRPVVWWYSGEDGYSGDAANGMWWPNMFLYEHSSGQTDNDPTGVAYSGHPLLKNFNFRFTIIK